MVFRQPGRPYSHGDHLLGTGTEECQEQFLGMRGFCVWKKLPNESLPPRSKNNTPWPRNHGGWEFPHFFGTQLGCLIIGEWDYSHFRGKKGKKYGSWIFHMVNMVNIFSLFARIQCNIIKKYPQKIVFVVELGSAELGDIAEPTGWTWVKNQKKQTRIEPLDAERNHERNSVHHLSDIQDFVIVILGASTGRDEMKQNENKMKGREKTIKQHVMKWVWQW